jgi:hypothetical protein
MDAVNSFNLSNTEYSVLVDQEINMKKVWRLG